MKLIISTHFFFLSKIVKAFLLIKCHAKGFARERGTTRKDSCGSKGTTNQCIIISNRLEYEENDGTTETENYFLIL